MSDNMEDMLRLNYNITNSKIVINDGKIYVSNNGNDFILQQVYDQAKIQVIYDIIRKQKLDNFFFEIKLNNRKSIFTQYKQKTYCLMHVKKNIYDISEHEINGFKIEMVEGISQYEINWLKAWKTKQNALVEIVGQNTYPSIISELVDYYIGLSEMAIQYLKNTDYEVDYGKKPLYLSGYRFDHENRRNPLNLVIDRKERNLAELIKNDFLFENKRKYTMDIINQLIKKEMLDRKIIVARLMFPTYFFDIIDKYMEGESVEEEINVIIKKNIQYEIFIKELIRA